MRVLFASALCACLAACSPSPSGSAVPASTGAQGAAPTSSASVPTGAVPSASNALDSTDPVVKSGMGQPCPDGAPQYPFLARYCDTAGRVSGVMMPVDLLHGVPPAGTEVLRHDARTPEPPGQEVLVAAEGERLWVRAVSCGACRRVMGWSFVGDLPRLRDTEIQSLQERLGLPRDPVLKTAAAWKKTLASLKPKLGGP